MVSNLSEVNENVIIIFYLDVLARVNHCIVNCWKCKLNKTGLLIAGKRVKSGALKLRIEVNNFMSVC